MITIQSETSFKTLHYIPFLWIPFARVHGKGIYNIFKFTLNNYYIYKKDDYEKKTYKKNII